MKDAEKPFADKGCALMGPAFQVHRTLGAGLWEEIYETYVSNAG
jgi:hypothetical protein